MKSERRPWSMESALLTFLGLALVFDWMARVLGADDEESGR